MSRVKITHRFYQKPFPYDFYCPDKAGPHPALCVTPILGQLAFLPDLFFERKFCRYFAENGYAVALIHRPIFEFISGQGLHQIQIYLEQSLERNKTVLRDLLEKKEVDSTRLGTFGISFGAVINSLWAVQEPLFNAHVLALGGGNLPEIFMASRDPLMRSYYKAAVADTKTDPATLKERLRTIFCLDPLRECRTLDPDKILLMLALFDRVVPFRFGLELKKAMGNPETVYIPLGHYFSILAIPALKPIALRFFDKKLKAGSECKASA